MVDLYKKTYGFEDLREIMALGVLATPAVVIDGGIMCTGRVPSAEEVRGWLGA